MTGTRGAVDVGAGRELDHGALHSEGVGFGVGQLSGEVAAAAVGVLVAARSGGAGLVGPGKAGVPPDLDHVVGALVVDHGPAPLAGLGVEDGERAPVAEGDPRCGGSPARDRELEQPLLEALDGQGGAGHVDTVEEQEERRPQEAGDRAARLGRGAVEPLVQEPPVDLLGGYGHGQLRETEGVGPLALVVAAGEDGQVGEGGAGDDPLGEVALPGRLGGERDRHDRVAHEQHRGDALGLELGDDRGGPGGHLGGQVGLVHRAVPAGDRFAVVAGAAQRAELRRVLLEADDAEPAVPGPQRRVARPPGRAARQTLATYSETIEIHSSGLAVAPHRCGACSWEAWSEPVRAAGDAQDALGSQLLGVGRRERRSVDRGEGLEPVDDLLGFGPGRHGVVAGDLAVVEHRPRPCDRRSRPPCR